MNKQAAPLAMAQPFRFEIGYFNPIVYAACDFHAHETIEVVYHVKGHGVTRVKDGPTFTFEEGSVNVYPPRVPHDQVTTLPGEDICVHMHPRASLPPELRMPFYVPPSLPEPLSDLVHRMSGGRLYLSEWEHAYYDAICCALMAKLVVARAENEQRIRAARSGSGGRTRRFHDLIAERYRSIDTLEEVAREMGISYSHIRGLFGEKYHISPKQWLMQVRIRRAQDLLLLSAMPLKAIADVCGFKTDRYLCTVFKKWTGLSPTEYREQTGGNRQPRDRLFPAIEEYRVFPSPAC